MGEEVGERNGLHLISIKAVKFDLDIGKERRLYVVKKPFGYLQSLLLIACHKRLSSSHPGHPLYEIPIYSFSYSKGKEICLVKMFPHQIEHLFLHRYISVSSYNHDPGKSFPFFQGKRSL